MKNNYRIVDISNKKFNNLTAIRYMYSKNRNSYWLFRCDCGNVGTYAARSVKFGFRLSCGRCFKNKNLTQDMLKYFFIYNQDAGLFEKKIKNKSKKKYAGCMDNLGYIIIRIDGMPYKAHRLAWLYVYGYFPENFIDHINKNKSDNSIKNLREVSIVCNGRNSKLNKNNTSGIKGVTYNKKAKKWKAQIVINGELKYLGMFRNITEAAAHRLSAEQCINWSKCETNSTSYKHIQEYIKRRK